MAQALLYYFLRRLRLGFARQDSSTIFAVGRPAAETARGDAAHMAGKAMSEGAPAPLWSRYGISVVFYSLLAFAVIALLNLPGAKDYVGADNDDVMRLVEVRDFLSGQGWFDLMQYRLGVEGGTLMHWSRLIDLPIAALILFFRQFLTPSGAEAAALLVWPMFLSVPLLAAMGLGGRRIGGPQVMQLAMVLTVVLIVTANRFLPGSIDHHNVQLVLVATIAAMLVDRQYRPASFAVAGVAAALAIAIGAETTPFVATACLVVAVLWAWHGEAFAGAARAFALTVAIAITIFFFSTVPPRLYPVVTCDSLSIGYYGIAAVGGALLFLSALLASRLSRELRFAVLAADGAAVLGTAFVLAPQCLQNPLNDLDPLLVTLWLRNVTEAQSILAQLRIEPASFGGFYAVGFFALSVCFFRIFRRDRVELHAILFSLILVAWAIAAIQVRGAIFANLLSILPLALLITELRRNANSDPDNMSAGFAFVVGALMAVPSAWALVGVFAAEGTGGIADRLKGGNMQAAIAGSADCESASAMRQMAGLEPTTVVAPSNSGADILRFTPHRVLTAPYHRNQGGMLTELHIGLATPIEAQAFLRGSDARLIAFCASDSQTKRLAEMKPDGLYAAIERGEIPAYLEPLPRQEGSGFALYRVDLPGMK